KRVDVEDVIARLRLVRRTLIAAQAPGFLGWHRSVRKQGVARDAAQEVDLDLLLARLVLDALHQYPQARRISRSSELQVDVPGLRSGLVRIQCITYLAQRTPEFGLLITLHHDPRQRRSRGCQQSYDRQRDDQLD